MKGKDDPSRCSIVVTGEELVELKRHAHQIPECPGLEERIRRYRGRGPLVMSRHELDWMVAVLDAVLHDAKGYPCPEYEPWNLEYVARTDDRCVACQRLYQRLTQESDCLHEIARKQRIKMRKQDLAQERRKEERDRADDSMVRIQAVFTKHKCPAFPTRVNRGYAIYHEGSAVARIRAHDGWWEVLWWSHRDKWKSIGDFGGVTFDTVEKAAKYVLEDPMGVFWR